MKKRILLVIAASLLVVGIASQMVVSQNEFGYAALDAVPADESLAGNVDSFQAEIQQLQAQCNVHQVFQEFHRRSSESDWQAILDVAQAEGVSVAASVRAGPVQSEGGWVLSPEAVEFLTAMQGHEALEAYFLVDEPFEKFDGEALRGLYREAKSIAPNVPIIVQFSREIARAELGYLPPEYAFTDGMCDWCMISALEFQNGVFDRDMLSLNQRVSREVIERENPSAKIWSTAQVFSAGKYYMPIAAEVQEMLDILLTPEWPELDGVMWQMWNVRMSADRSVYDVLKDSQFGAQRQVVADNAPSQPSPTPTATPTAAPPTKTPTNTPAPTSTAVPTSTSTSTPLPTETPTPVPTSTFTATPTATSIAAPTSTPTPAPTPQLPWWCRFFPWHPKCKR